MKIGLFDSGIGGTTILDSVRQVLLNEDYKYIADSAHCPDGEKMTPNSRQSLELTSILSKIGAPKSSSSPAIPLPLDVLLFSASTIQICILLAPSLPSSSPLAPTPPTSLLWLHLVPLNRSASTLHLTRIKTPTDY